MEKYLKLFTEYISKNYDMENELVRNKYYHSTRVANLMYYLAGDLNLDSEEIRLAYIIGLFHDLGRFREVIRSSKFNNLTFDHGAYSNKILYNDGLVNELDIKDNEHLILRKAIYYHNKKDLGNDLNNDEQLFAKMIRDADKLDILNMRVSGKRLKFTPKVNEIVLNNFLENETIDLKDIKNSSDSILLYLSFIKDLYFDESYQFAINNQYLDRLINIIDVDLSMNNLFNEIIEKVKERGKGYVRKKV